LTATRLGVLGGSFNPVHFGHLRIAQRCREIFELSQVLFVVASVPPHKPPQGLIPFAHRYAMVSLATSGHPDFVPSAAELEPPASSYSIDTLRKLEQQFGVRGKDIYFIAGGDSLMEVAGWHKAEDLLQAYNFIFVMRPGFTAPDLARILPRPTLARVTDLRGLTPDRMRRDLAGAVAAPECRIFPCDVEAPDIASSQIRILAGAAETLGHLVPASVHEYILKLHLYGER
jgi:nicotinate-nucleotide adenylyltransferase